MFADHQGDQFSYNIWTVDDDENREKGKELTWYILITRVSGPEPSATSLQSLAEFEHDIQFKKLPKRHQRKKTKIRGKRNRKREAYRDLKPGPTQRKQQKESPWTDHINDDLTMCTADLTEDQSDYDKSLDPAAHLIRKPPPTDHDYDTVPVYIVTGGEQEDADHVLNEDPLGEFDYNKPHQAEEIYNEFAPGRDTLNE